ncbi:MAG: N-acetylmuramoyl-L-alanine amidase [Acutalibacter sp.]|nr:N-acetylmuramoyl-L-alanine amidase [Acutalibacter sp.]
MAPIRIKLCPESRYSIKCPFTRTPTRIVVHNTGNDATAENEISYMIRNSEEKSFHYAVDDKEIVQGLPLNRNAWASGDGRGKGNMEGIHIEICYSLSGGERFAKAEQNAAQLIASLLKQYGWGIDKVTKHQDYDGKYCPHRTLGLGWQRFLNIVKSYMKGGGEEMRYNKISEMPIWAQPTIKKLCDKKLLSGNGGSKDSNGYPADLDLSADMIRILAINDRAGVYGE